MTALLDVEINSFCLVWSFGLVVPSLSSLSILGVCAPSPVDSSFESGKSPAFSFSF